MSENCECGCKVAPTLIFSCSGAADLGEISDRAARMMTRNGTGKMFCLAGIGGRVSDILNMTRSAEKILAIDGCSQNCAKNSLEQAGFTDYRHLQITDLGWEKGQTPPTEERVLRIAAEGAEKLAS